MSTGLPSLSHAQQEQAVGRIQDLMSKGMSSGEAIQQVAREIRESHTGEMITARFEDEDDEEEESSTARYDDEDDEYEE
ncbi:YoaH family protein [Erwiniaceae bacterium BAC15a-03b]|uniref:UPF0181 protein N5923_17855 n=1 Tax=Winslowiella arboricola TaxID=2978220 RepID=A0A9J6PV04_9GAMM|nr:YoaH family protein [Winslowiella arboricola]MCU5775798.1 YoaH family protein [Winslowiella arboricola]MCU5779352.1 YoaH family protein [Winslowiella arboricola]